MHSVKPASRQTYPAGLYIVSTPIGNLRDITLRALDVLALVDLILCEDTRVSGRLLAHYGVDKPLLSYHDHNGALRRPQVLQALADGKRVALISDAGTPLISDPGYKLVCLVQQEGYHVSVLPGASSVLAALCLSGLPTDQFHFLGFFPQKQQALASFLHQCKSHAATLIGFESAKRLQATLTCMLEVFGDREVAVVREITKLFEECNKAPITALLSVYERQGAPKGEVVLVIAPAPPESEDHREEAVRLLTQLLQTYRVKEAVEIVASQTGRPRKEIYAIALALKASS